MVLIGIGLAVVFVILAVVALATARPPRDPFPNWPEHLRRWSSAHGGIDPQDHRLVVPWLRAMHAAGRPLARAGIHPDVITASGVWWSMLCWAFAAASGRWALVAVVALVAGGMSDGLDGTVAALSGRASGWGGVLDGIADRVADVFYLLALVAVGADGRVAVVAGGALMGLEYLRAVAGQHGARVTRVTVGERPTRLVLVGVSLWCAGLFPAEAAAIVSLGAWSVAAVAVVGVLQLLPSVYADLH